MQTACIGIDSLTEYATFDETIPIASPKLGRKTKKSLQTGFARLTGEGPS